MIDFFNTRRPHTKSIGIAKALLADELQRKSVDSEFIHLLDNPTTTEVADLDNIPIPAPSDREGYYDDRHLAYWLSGLSDFLNISRAASHRKIFPKLFEYNPPNECEGNYPTRPQLSFSSNFRPEDLNFE